MTLSDLAKYSMTRSVLFATSELLVLKYDQIYYVRTKPETRAHTVNNKLICVIPRKRKIRALKRQYTHGILLCGFSVIWYVTVGMTTLSSSFCGSLLCSSIKLCYCTNKLAVNYSREGLLQCSVLLKNY